MAKFKNGVTNLNGNRRRYVNKEDIYCNHHFMWERWNNFRPSQITVNKAVCRKCHGERSYRCQREKLMRLFPDFYAECDGCDNIYKISSGCRTCKHKGENIDVTEK